MEAMDHLPGQVLVTPRKSTYVFSLLVRGRIRGDCRPITPPPPPQPYIAERCCLVSTDDFAGWLANQTNLALKGVLGIQAMSRIAELAGHDEDATYYKVCE